MSQLLSLTVLSATLLLILLVQTEAQRNPGQFSPPGCGPNSWRDSCTDGCPRTCDLDDDNCVPSDKCIEDCACFPGYVKNPVASGCIEESECKWYF